MPINDASSDPLYQQVKDILRGEVETGRLKPGAGIPHERSLAESLGVSRKTTRRAIVELTREGLFRRIRGRGTYVRDSMAVQPIRRDGVLIACPFSPFTAPFYGKILEGIYQTASKANVLTAFEYITRPYDAFMTKVRRYESMKGMLAIGVDDPELSRQLVRLDIPVVVVDGDHSSENQVFDVVGHDIEPGMFSAVKYLHDLGHDDIAFLGSENATGSNLGRLNGYARAMKALNVGKSARMIMTGYYPEAAYATTTRLLKGADVPTALVCMSDDHALGAMEAVKDFGWNVPADISIIGVGDLGYFTSPRLSTVRVPKEQLGSMAMQVLEMRRTHPTSPLQRLMLPVEWVSRSSCDVPRRSADKGNVKLSRKTSSRQA